ARSRGTDEEAPASSCAPVLVGRVGAVGLDDSRAEVVAEAPLSIVSMRSARFLLDRLREADRTDRSDRTPLGASQEGASVSCVSSVTGFRVDLVDRGRRPTSDLVLHRAVSDPPVVLEPIEPRVELRRLSEPRLIRPVGVTLRERGFVEGLDPAEQRPSV